MAAHKIVDKLWSRPVTPVLLLSAFGFLTMVSVCEAQDGLERLMPKARLNNKQVETEPTSEEAFQIPSAIPDYKTVQRAGHSQDLNFTDPAGFSTRSQGEVFACDVVPKPIGYGKVYDPQRPSNPWNPNSQRDEYVYDGDDRGKPVQVDQSWNIYGLDTEDTVGHFDTLDGRRLVTPSNRVAIYAPRFAAVRRVDGLFNAQSNVYVGEMEEKTILAQADLARKSTTAKQHVSLDRFEGAKRASGLLDRTRGVVADNVTHLFGVRNTYQPFENLSLIRIGKHENSQNARLNLGIQSANVWEDDLGLQVTTQKAQPIIVNDVAIVQQLVSIESDDDAAILRVVKIASKIAARPGEDVDFTIRFDNLTGRRIGNVTIINNLTRRLEYVPETAECSVKAEFIESENEAGSLMLRWEITDPLPANSGGIIRFRCKVR